MDGSRRGSHPRTAACGRHSLVCFSFLPHLSELNTFARKGSQAESGTRSTLYPLALAGEKASGIGIQAIRSARLSLAEKNQRMRMIWHHLDGLLWYFASFIHFDDDEMFALWVQCALNGCEQGLPTEANRFFEKSLTALSISEQAALVAAIRSPSMFAPGSERGAKRAAEILRRTILP